MRGITVLVLPANGVHYSKTILQIKRGKHEERQARTNIATTRDTLVCKLEITRFKGRQDHT